MLRHARGARPSSSRARSDGATRTVWRASSLRNPKDAAWRRTTTRRGCSKGRARTVPFGEHGRGRRRGARRGPRGSRGVIEGSRSIRRTQRSTPAFTFARDLRDMFRLLLLHHPKRTKRASEPRTVRPTSKRSPCNLKLSYVLSMQGHAMHWPGGPRGWFATPPRRVARSAEEGGGRSSRHPHSTGPRRC